MNGTVANEVIIAKIARELSGILFEYLTTAEKCVVNILQSNGWVTLDGKDKVVTITPYGAKYV
jgi:hypothetical protein